MWLVLLAFLVVLCYCVNSVYKYLLERDREFREFLRREESRNWYKVNFPSKKDFDWKDEGF